MRIIYMGTPEFAIPPLAALIKEGYDVVGVITAPDKPSGRGKHLRPSPVKEFALRHKLNVLQPVKLKDSVFLEELKKLDADLQIVVAFRMLPTEVWEMPPLGTFNLHASLLPQYRGAAPINHVIINGEKETGLTTFFIDAEIDTGRLIFSKKTRIGPTETAGELHDRLMEMGAGLIIKTVKAIENGNVPLRHQEEVISADEQLKPAPKIFREDCRINWENSVEDIYNFIRGLSPYPSAFSTMQNKNGDTTDVKIFTSVAETRNHSLNPGTILPEKKDRLSVAAGNGFVHITELQLPGKKRMDAGSFLRGFSALEDVKFI